jgi:hypothetical protein
VANDKKPKKAQPPVVHGSSRNSDLASRLAEPAKKAPAAPAKKKK